MTRFLFIYFFFYNALDPSPEQQQQQSTVTFVSPLLCHYPPAEKETGGRLAPSPRERKATSPAIMLPPPTPSKLKSETALC